MMATTTNLQQNEEEVPVNTTGEPTEQFESEYDDLDENPSDDDDLDDEPYEGIRHEDDDDDDLVDDNMTGMPVVPSPS